MFVTMKRALVAHGVQWASGLVEKQGGVSRRIVWSIYGFWLNGFSPVRPIARFVSDYSGGRFGLSAQVLFRFDPTPIECEEAQESKNMSKKSTKIDTQQIV